LPPDRLLYRIVADEWKRRLINKYGDSDNDLPTYEINAKVVAMTTVKESDVVNTIYAMEEEFMRHMAVGDVKQLVTNFYAEDAQLLPPNHPLVVGRSAIQQVLEGLIAAGLHDLVLRIHKIEVSGEFAYAIGKHRYSIRTASGTEIHDEGKYLVVYRSQPGGGWRSVADIFNSDLPLAQDR
jgi:ketosteroid isomerase-like protein